VISFLVMLMLSCHFENPVDQLGLLRLHVNKLKLKNNKSLYDPYSRALVNNSIKFDTSAES
jgi:hypothetical protein